MKGADIVYFELSRNRLVDAYSLDSAMPIKDQQQDWSLLSSSNIGGTITVEIQRALCTGDAQDNDILDDSWPAVDGTRYIAAWGDSPSIQYHGLDNVNTGQVRFFTPPPQDPLSTIRADPSIRSFDILQKDFLIPMDSTTYDHQCFPLGYKQGGPINLTAKQHIVALEYLRDPSSGPQGNVHHIVLSCFRSKYGNSSDYWPIDYLRYLEKHPDIAKAGPYWPVPKFPSFFTGTG